MTKAAIPSADMEPTSQLPAYMSDTNLSAHSEETLDEKPKATPCCTAQATPHIDAQMRNPNMRAHMLTLSAALASAANDDTCAKCSLDNVAQSMTAFMKDVRAAKESGDWSREEKKALKKEAKVLAKGMKQDARKMWKAK